MDLKQGDLENIILNALWDLESEGATKIYVGDIQDRIRSGNKKWAYTTVKTVLDRLVDKDISEREKDGKKYVYRSRVKRNEAGYNALQKVMRQYFKNDVNELLTVLQQIKPGQVPPASVTLFASTSGVPGNTVNAGVTKATVAKTLVPQP